MTLHDIQPEHGAVSVVGLGKLGAPLAAVLASKGFSVIGVDVNESFVAQLSAGRAPVSEPGLQELIDLSRARLQATTDVGGAVLASEVTFIIVPTPSNEHGVFSNKHVLSAVSSIGAALRSKQGYHVVNVTSTVMPGSTDGEIREALEHSSGRRVGHDVGLCYNPEFIALGSVIRDMLHPDTILIGESDRRAGDVLEALYRRVCGGEVPVQRMSLVNAELTKLSVNTFITMKISYANMLADLCDRIAGADVDVVTAAVGLDSRIGRKYLRGALGYGGPCFPRDNVALTAFARRLGARADLAEATDHINRFQVERLTRIVTDNLEVGRTVGVLGLSYKPDTGVIEESQGVELAKTLAAMGYRVIAFDPRALGSAAAVLRNMVTPAKSAADCAREADLVVITTAWPEFRELPLAALQRREGKLPVVDCWRALDPTRYGAVAELIYLGKGPSEAAEADLAAMRGAAR